MQLLDTTGRNLEKFRFATPKLAQKSGFPGFLRVPSAPLRYTEVAKNPVSDFFVAWINKSIFASSSCRVYGFLRQPSQMDASSFLLLAEMNLTSSWAHIKAARVFLFAKVPSWISERIFIAFFVSSVPVFTVCDEVTVLSCVEMEYLIPAKPD